MKKAKILLISAMALAMLLMTGCGDNGSNLTQGDETLDALPNNVTIINTTQEGIEADPMALSTEEAAAIGSKYISDIFGESMDGMYVELEFTDWEHVTRTMWHGAVSQGNRNTLALRARHDELNEEIMARHEAGEDFDDIFADMSDIFRNYTYTPARIYFIIDAITGERIDIWQTMPAHMPTVDQSIELHEYIEQEWNSDWTAAFEVDIPAPEIDALGLIAREYAQRHFSDSAIASMDFESAFVSFIYTGGGFKRDPSASFLVINDAGREARVSIHVESRTVTSINTMTNDFVPFDIEDFEGERIERD